MTKPNNDAFDAAFADAFNAAFEPKSDLALISDAIMGNYKRKPADKINEECGSCHKWTGEGQYYERDGGYICRHCRMYYHPSYFDPKEVRLRQYQRQQEENDRDILLDIANRQGAEWVSDVMLTAGYFHP